MIRILALFSLLSLSVMATATDEFDVLLGQFEKTPRAKEANCFFEWLNGEDFTDGLLSFDNATPTDSLCAQVWYWAAEYLYDRQQYKRAAEYGEKTLALMKGTVGEADCLNLLAITFTRLADYDSAAKYAKRCYALDERKGDPDMMSSSLNTLAGIYMGAYQPKEAEKYVLKALDAADKAGNDARKAVLMGMASEVYHALGNDRKSLAYAEQSYDMENRLGHVDKALLRLSMKASALIGLHEYRRAEQTLKEVMPALRDIGDMHSLAIADNKMGMALLCQDRQREAIPYFNEAADMLQKMGDMANEMHARKGLYESYWDIRPDSAKIALDRFNDLKDSLYNSASAESLAKYNAEFGNDWLKKENEARKREKRLTVAWAAGIVALLLLISASAWWAMTKRQRRQRLLNQRLKANMDELREKYRQLSLDENKDTSGTHDTDDAEEINNDDKDFVEKASNVIHAMMLEGQVDAKGVAREMGMSLYLFRRRLDKTTGEKPQDFITKLRMQRAKHMLDNCPEMSINEIAVLCAYNDTPNFTRAFKKFFGMTPTQYQRKQG